MSKKPTVLMILDGYGLNKNCEHNAVCEGKTPIMDQLMSQCPFVEGQASGMFVGLPDGQMGNSEVGHMNMGAGRVVYQELTRITKSIQDGDFFRIPEFLTAVENCKKHDSALHLFGLVSDGGVHSHLTHIFGLLELAKRNGLEKVYVHCFLDGRDTPPESGKGYVEQLEAKMKEIGVGEVASVMGRYYAMDRDNRWDRVARAYDAIAFGDAPFADDPAAAVQRSYDGGVTDEFMEPVVCAQEAGVRPGDGIIFYNFRPDRARELTRVFADPDFSGFVRKQGYFPVDYVCTTEYDAAMPNVEVAYPRQQLSNIFGAYISERGLTQLRIAETEKYAHVTFFFNGGVEQTFPGEDRCLIPSPKVATYDLQPEMSQPEVTKEAVARIKSGKYDVVILNFANCDMVGHTGVYDAAVRAVEAVDDGVGQVVAATLEMGGAAIVTADHGNAEHMVNDNGSPFTAHTTNLVPCCLAGRPVKLRDGRLADLAPTMLELLGLEKPPEMTGESLIVR